MRNIVGIWLFTVLIVLSSGCVSKKKYSSMEALKNQYLKQSTALQKENATLKNSLQNGEIEFESTKEELHLSNAKKDETLLELSNRLKDMEQNFSRAQTELSKTRDLYKDQRYYNTQASNEITRLEFQVEQFKRDTVSLNYSLRLAKERTNEIQKRLEERVDQVNSKNTDIAGLNNLIAQKEAQIKQLGDKLDLQNKKLDEISTAFIELRKEMLRAKAGNVILDPATEPNVAKISKALGHF